MPDHSDDLLLSRLTIDSFKCLSSRLEFSPFLAGTPARTDLGSLFSFHYLCDPQTMVSPDRPLLT